MFPYFDINNALANTPEPYNSYGENTPPFGVESLKGSKFDSFRRDVQSYQSLRKNDKSKKNEDVAITIGDIPFEKKKESYWHSNAAKKICQDSFWKYLMDSVEDKNKKEELINLKNEFFNFLEGAEYKTEFLYKNYQILKRINTYHKKCLDDYVYLNKFHGKGPIVSNYFGVIKIPGFVCPLFKFNFKAYLDMLGRRIAEEREILVRSMIGRLKVASLTKDLNNGDVVFYVARKIEILTGTDHFSIKKQDSAIALERKVKKLGLSVDELSERNQWFLPREEPTRDLEFKTFQLFHECIVMFLRDFQIPTTPEQKIDTPVIAERSLNESPLKVVKTSIESFLIGKSENSSDEVPLNELAKRSLKHFFWLRRAVINVELEVYKEDFLIIPANRANMLKTNLKAKQILRMNWWAVLDFNLGISDLIDFFGLDFTDFCERKVRAKEKLQLKFKSLALDVQQITKLSQAIDRATYGLMNLWDLLIKFGIEINGNNYFKRDKSSQEFYLSWETELSLATTRLNSFANALVSLFKFWSLKEIGTEIAALKSFPLLQVSPLIKSLRNYDAEFDRLERILKTKAAVQRDFKTIYKEGIDQIFFQLFIEILREPRQEFVREIEGPLGRTIKHDTPHALGLVDLLVALELVSPQLVLNIGNVWTGKYENLMSHPGDNLLDYLKLGFKLNSFNSKVNIGDEVHHQRFLFNQLLKVVRSACDDNIGQKILFQAHTEEKARNNSTVTLFDDWTAQQKVRVSEQVQGIVFQIRKGGDEEFSSQLINQIQELPPFESLDGTLKQTLLSVLTQYIDCYKGNLLSFLPVLQKINDPDLVKFCLEKRLNRSIKISLKEICLDLEFFGTIFKESSLKKEFQKSHRKQVVSKIEAFFENFRGIEDPRKINAELEQFCTGINLEDVATLWHLFVNSLPNGMKPIEERNDEFFFALLKKCALAWDLFPNLTAFYPSFPVTESYKRKMDTFMKEEILTQEWRLPPSNFLRKFSITEESKKQRNLYDLKALHSFLFDSSPYMSKKFFELCKSYLGNLEILFGSSYLQSLEMIDQFFKQSHSTDSVEFFIQTSNPLTEDRVLFLDYCFGNDLIETNSLGIDEQQNTKNLIQKKYRKIKSFKKSIDKWLSHWKEQKLLTINDLESVFVSHTAIESELGLSKKNDLSFYRCIFLYFHRGIKNILDENIISLKNESDFEKRDCVISSSSNNCQVANTLFKKALGGNIITKFDADSFQTMIASRIANLPDYQ